MIEWKQSFSVNLDVIDDDHRKMFAIMKDVYSAFRDKKPKENLAPIINDLVSYTEHHFAHEEELMDTYNYPESEVHKQEHEKLRKTVHQYLEAYEKGGDVRITEKLLHFIHSWIINHIEETDRKLASYLRFRQKPK